MSDPPNLPVKSTHAMNDDTHTGERNPHGIVEPAWLDLVREPILDPDLPIVDAHHHLWTRAGSPYLVPEFLTDIQSGHRIAASVYVQCYSMYRLDALPPFAPLGETEFTNGVAAEFASGIHGDVRACAGIVGYVDLAEGASAEAALLAHQRAAGERFKGVRNISVWHEDGSIQGSLRAPPRGLLGSAAFRQGLRLLAPLGLSFDAWMYHTQLDELRALAGAYPDISIVLDHIGSPLGVGPYRGRRDEVFRDWQAAIADVAACPNVCIKLSGLGMKIAGFDFDTRALPPDSDVLAQAWSPYLLTCIEQFGPQRCMFASNFPVDKTACSYPVLWNAFKRMTSGFSASERAALFHGTACRVYRLPTPPA